MIMKKNRGWFIIIFLLINTVFGLFANVKIQASTVSFNLQQDADAYWIQEGNPRAIPGVNEAISIPYGSKIGMYITVRNTSGNVHSNATIHLKESLQYYDYYPGVLKVNGVSLSHAQYQAFVSSEGLVLDIGNNPTTIYIELMSVGSQRNKISADLDISSSEVNYGLKRVVCEHAFSGRFSFLQAHTVRFFGASGELLSSQILNENEKAIAPPITLVGHDFIGFNTNKDGQGVFFDANNGIHQTQDYYAIFDIKKFKVNYYVEGELFATRIVNYDNNAEELIPPSKKNNKFIRWNADLTSVKQNIDVHAVFENDRKGQVHFQLKHSIGGNNSIEQLKNYMIAFSSDKVTNDENYINEVVYMKPKNKSEYYIGLIIVSIGISNALFSLLSPNYKKNERF